MPVSTTCFRVLIIMPRHRPIRFAVPAGLMASSLVILAAGCGSEVSRQPVSGMIDGLGGRPGTVTFLPDEGVHGPAARTTLRNGNFTFDTTDGPLPGTYRVRVDLQRARRLTGGTIIVKEVAVPESAVGEMPPAMESFFIDNVRVGDSGRQTLHLSLPPASSRQNADSVPREN